MAQVTVKFVVKSNAKELYIAGSTKNLGEWDAANAVALKEGTLTKKFEEGTQVEFKVLSAKAWANVEKDSNGADVENHSFVATKGQVVEVEAYNFAK